MRRCMKTHGISPKKSEKGVRRIARALGASLDVRRTAQTIADLALEMAGADRCVLLTLRMRRGT